MVHKKILDKKTCILAELNQKSSDGYRAESGEFKWQQEDMAMVIFYSNGKLVELGVNIDSCRRITQDSRVGPMDIADRQMAEVIIEQLVNQLFCLQPKEAVDIVIHNVPQGLKSVRAYLNSAAPLQSSHGLSFSTDLEADLKNASIKLMNGLICKAGGGTAVMISMNVFLDELYTGLGPPQRQALQTGAFSTMALLMYLEIYSFLEEVLERPLMVAAAGWVLWIFQAFVSRLRQVIADLPPLPRFDLNREAIKSAFMEIVRQSLEVSSSVLGLVTPDVAAGRESPSCSEP